MRNSLKTIRFLVLQLLLITVMFSGCKEEEEELILVAGKEKITFEGEGGEQNLRFDCNSSWILSCDVSWLSFKAREGVGNGIVPVTCENNDGTALRSGVIEICSGGTVFSVTVEQLPVARYFSITAETVAIPATGGLVDVPVTGNVYFLIKTELPWIEQVLSADVPENILRLRVAPNYSLTDRSVKLVAGDTEGVCVDSILISQSFATDSRATDSLALVALYHSAGGDAWNRKWDVEQSLDRWPGIALEAVRGGERVTQILLWENNMNGSLPEELRYLSQLTVLHLAGNHLEGALPAAMVELKKLNLLALQGNNFEGTMPSGIGTLSLLTDFYIDNNRFSGDIPAAILNNIHWEAWKSAGFCRQQNGYGFSNCDDVNEVERDERNILLALYQATNGDSWSNRWDLTAPITEWQGVVTEMMDGNLRVKELNLWSNNLTGRLPEEIGGLAECVQFHIGGNAVTGEIPAGLGDLKKLALLGLQGNQFTGSVPAKIGGLKNLSSFYIDTNKLGGEIPPEILANPHWNNWREAGFCNQQAGFGFTNCR